jgi:hypothetical protein
MLGENEEGFRQGSSAGLVTAKQPSRRFDIPQSLFVVSEEEAASILAGFAQADDNAEKTWSRKFVTNILQHFDWYFPKSNRKDAPSLAVAWAYYEHVTLPRHFGGQAAADTVMRRAEPGEQEETDLYSPFWTPHTSLIEWGTGVDLYFISLKFFAVIMLIAGLINIASMRYYGSDKYGGIATSDRMAPLRGSAICLNTAFVACTDCNPSEWESDPTRFAMGINNVTSQEQVLVLRNLCEGAELENGITNFATLIFLLISVGIFSFYLKLREIRFDEDKVTTTDYTIAVKNPPPDAVNVDEWRDFFQTYADKQVTCITIALNNEQLIRKLITRRIFRNQLRVKLPKGLDLDDEDALRVAVDQFTREKAEEEHGCIGRMLESCVFPLLRKVNMFLEPETLVDKVVNLTAEIIELQMEKYDATEVYVTFETEEGQRAALSALTAGKINSALNNTHSMSPGCVFKDRVLKVTEPPEPSAVRWLDLSAGTTKKILMRMLTFFLTTGIIAFASFTIAKARSGVGVFFSGPLTTIWNSVIPLFIKTLMVVEPHADEGSFQASLYLKITIFRWTLSAILAQVRIRLDDTSSTGYKTKRLADVIICLCRSDR